MDGKALLDSLADWTAESHPNASLEARQHNNELMADFRSELFNLLGTSTQVGGAEGISIVQPMDEALISQLSPAELEYRLDLAEFAGQTGGKNINSHPLSQPVKDLGYMKRYKIWRGLRTFNDFVDDFEKLRAQINTNMAGYEVEAQRTKDIGDELVKTIRRRFLNAKLKTLWEIIKANEDALKKDEGRIKRDVLVQRIERAKSEELRLQIETDKQRKIVKKAFEIKKSWYKLNIKFDIKKGFVKTKKNITIVDKLEEDVKKQVKAYAKLNTEMNYYTKQITEAKNLKALEAIVASKPVEELTKAQRRELAKYQQNREKYEKMYGFGETKREEYEKLVNKKENLLITLEFLRTTLYAEKYLRKETNMTKALTDWQGYMNSVYTDISECITNSGTYKGDLDKLRILIAENANNISKLLSGMPEFEGIKAEYEKYMEQCEKAYEYQESIHNTLGEIKNKFIELIPDKALLPDMFRVTRAQGFVLSIVNEILSKKQLELGGSYDTGMRYFDRKIRELKGGASGSSDVVPHKVGLTGGFYKQIDPETVAELITHGGTFYEHTNDATGKVYDCVSATYLPPTTTLQHVQILSLPFGVRRINDDYIRNIKKAINHITVDSTVYLPLLDLDDERIYILTAKAFPGHTGIRITGLINNIKTTNANDKQYTQITGQYYFFNLFAREIDKTNGASSLKDNNKFLKIGDQDMLLLPVFYNINTVNNDLFEYDEYVLLHPLFGTVMSAFLKETDLKRYTAAGAPAVPVVGPAPNDTFEQRYPARTAFEYDFINPAGIAVGNLPELPLHLKMERHATMDKADIEKKYDYYYNFCGQQITIKAQAAASGFLASNFSKISYPPGSGGLVAPAAPAAGNLQPSGELKLFEYDRIVSLYSQYIAQLTGHLHELIRRVRDINIDTTAFPATANPKFITSTAYKDPFPEYHLGYNLDRTYPPPVGARIDISGINNPNYVTQLGHIGGGGKIWSGEYQENMLDISDTATDIGLIHGLIPIKVLIMELIYWMETDDIPIKDTDPATYKTLLASAASVAGIPPELIPGPGTGPGGAAGPGTGTGPVVPTKVNPYADPKVIARREFLERAIPNPGAYWTNLGEMTTILSKFKSNDYVNYSNKLFKLFDTMQLIKKVEDNILNISADKDGFKVPDFTLIAANLEAKPDTSSKDAFTNAGKKLHDKLKDDKDFITKNRATVPSGDYVAALSDIVYKISKFNLSDNFLTNLATITEFNYSPYNQYQAILESDEGAKEFVRQLNTARFLSNDDIPKVVFGITHILGITKARFPEAYKHYELDINKAIAKLATKKKGHGRGHGHKPKHRGGGRGGH